MTPRTINEAENFLCITVGTFSWILHIHRFFFSVYFLDLRNVEYGGPVVVDTFTGLGSRELLPLGLHQGTSLVD